MDDKEDSLRSYQGLWKYIGYDCPAWKNGNIYAASLPYQHSKKLLITTEEEGNRISRSKDQLDDKRYWEFQSKEKIKEEEKDWKKILNDRLVENYSWSRDKLIWSGILKSKEKGMDIQTLEIKKTTLINGQIIDDMMDDELLNLLLKFNKQRKKIEKLIRELPTDYLNKALKETNKTINKLSELLDERNKD